MKCRLFYRRALAVLRSEDGRYFAEPVFDFPAKRCLLPSSASGCPDGAYIEISLKKTGRALPLVESWKVLARPQTALAALYGICDENRINPYYPEDVEDEVTALLTATGLDDPALADLTCIPFVTIDNDGSRDLDQALHIERDGDSGYIIRYALADASYYVRPGGALFREALERAVTYYLPLFSIPMLPPALSEGLVSLNPLVERRCLCFEIRLDNEGATQGVDIFRARIRSRARLSYSGVQEYFDDPGNSGLLSCEFSESLTLLARVGKLLMKRAASRNVVHFHRHELEVIVEEGDGPVFSVREETRNLVSRCNEQISLLCNIEGARFLGEKAPHVQPVFRVHEAPGEQALCHLREVIAAIVSFNGMDAGVWLWKRKSESLASYLERLPRSTEAEARVAESIERHILLTNMRSTYSAEPGPHYALGVAAYSRFSAPMREIVGIFTHKEALEKKGVEKPSCTDEEDEITRSLVIEAANMAREKQARISKAAMSLAVNSLLGGDLSLPFPDRPTRRGTIIGLTDTRLYVRLERPPIVIKVYTDHLAEKSGGKLKADPTQTALVDPDSKNPVFVAGQRIGLKTSAFDDKSGKWLLCAVD